MIDFITIAKIAGAICLKAFDLHEAGTDVKILKDVESLMFKANKLLGHPHKKLLTFHTLGQAAGAIFLKAFDLHETGTDTKIVDESHDLLSKVHDILTAKGSSHES